MDSLQTVLKKFSTNKNLQTIVNLVFCVVRYVLYESGCQDMINLGGPE